MKKVIKILFFILFFKNNIAAQYTYNTGIAYSTEAFNIENIYINVVGPYEQIQYNPSRFFGGVHLYNCVSKGLTKNTVLSFENYLRYNHHYYKRIPRNYGLENHNNIPQVRKLKLDLYLNLRRHIRLNNKNKFVIGIGIGANNINSGYSYMYNDTLSNGRPFNQSFKGNWLKFSPQLQLGIQHKKYSFIIDGYFIKDYSFNDLLTVSARLTVARKLVTF